VSNLQIVTTAAGLRVGDIRITGETTNADGSNQLLPVQYDLDGDGKPDGQIYSSSDPSGSFSFDIPREELAAGPIALQVRALEALPGTGAFALGQWFTLNFEYSLPNLHAGELQAMHLVHDLTPGMTPTTADLLISGTLWRDAGSVSNIPIEVDLDADGTSDLDTFTGFDNSGSFTVDLSRAGLALGPATVQLRPKLWSADYGDYLPEAWQSFSFIYGTAPAAAPPQIVSVQLFNNTGILGDNITADPSLTGSAVDPEGQTGEILLDYDLNGDHVADGTGVAVGEDGHFIIPLSAAQFSTSDVTVGVRAKRQIEETGAWVASAWQSISFTLQATPNILPTFSSLVLADDTGTPGDGITTDATFSGQVQNPDGSASVVPVQYDLNADGQSDGFINTLADGSFSLDLNSKLTANVSTTIRFRPGELLSDGIYHYGNWQPVTFQYAGISPASIPSVTNIHLVSDTGTEDDDNITSDLRLTGTVILSGGGSPDGLPVQVDLDGDGNAEQVVYTDFGGNGHFQVDLRGNVVAPGAVNVRFRAGSPTNSTSGFNYGDWATFQFEYQSDPIAPVTAPDPHAAPTAPPVPSFPAYSYTLFATLPMSLPEGSAMGALTLDSVEAGKFDRFLARFYNAGTVHTVVNGDHSDSQTVPDDQGGSSLIETTVLSTLTTEADVANDGTWTVSQELASSYHIVTTYTGTGGLTYTLTQTGSHNYTFYASGNATEVTYSLSETRTDDWVHDRTEPTVTTSTATIGVTSHGHGSQKFTFAATGTAHFSGNAISDSQEDWTYEPSYSSLSSYTRTTTTQTTLGPATQVDTMSTGTSLDTTHDLTNVFLNGTRTFADKFTIKGLTTSKLEDGNSFQTTVGPDWDKFSWHRKDQEGISSDFDGQITTTYAGVTKTVGGQYTWSYGETKDYDLLTGQDTYREDQNPGSTSKLTVGQSHDYSLLSSMSHIEKINVDNQSRTTEQILFSETLQATRHDIINSENLITSSNPFSGSTVSQTEDDIDQSDILGVTNYTAGSQTDYASDGSWAGSGHQENVYTETRIETESDSSQLSSSGSTTAFGTSTYSDKTTTNSIVDVRGGEHTHSGASPTSWLSKSQGSTSNIVWNYQMSDSVSGGFAAGPGTTVSFSTNVSSQANGSGKQAYEFNSYRKDTGESGYAGVGSDQDGKPTISIPSVGTLGLNFSTRSAEMMGVSAWNSANQVSVSGANSNIPVVMTSFSSSQSFTDQGTGSWAGNIAETMSDEDPATRTLFGSSNSTFNGNTTFSGSQSSSASGTISNNAGISTTVSKSEQSTSSGKGTYSGKTFGSAMGQGDTYTADYNEDRSDNGTSTFSSSGSSTYDSLNNSGYGVSSHSVTVSSSSDKGNGTDSSSFKSNTKTLTTGQTSFTSTLQDDSSVSGDVTSDSKITTSTSGVSSGLTVSAIQIASPVGSADVEPDADSLGGTNYSTTYSNSSQTTTSSKGTYNTSDSHLETKVNSDLTTKSTATRTEDGTTDSGTITSGQSKTYGWGPSGVGSLATSSSTGDRTASGTYSSQKTSETNTSPSGSTQVSSEKSSAAESGVRHSQSTSTLAYQGTTSTSTDKASWTKTWSGKNQTGEAEEADFASSETTESGSKRTELPAANNGTGVSETRFESTTSQESEDGKYSYFRTSTSSGIKSGNYPDLLTFSYSQDLGASAITGGGKFGSTATHTKTSGSLGDLDHSEGNDWRTDAGQTVSASSSNSWSHYFTAITEETEVEVAPEEGETMPSKQKVYVTTSTTRFNSSSDGEQKAGKFSSLVTHSEESLNGVTGLTDFSEYSEQGKSLSTSTDDNWESVTVTKSTGGKHTDFQRNYTQSDGTGKYFQANKDSSTLPLGGKLSTSSEFHATEDSEGDIDTYDISIVTADGPIGKATFTDNGSNVYHRKGKFTDSSAEDSFTQDQHSSSSSTETYQESGTAYTDKVVHYKADASYDEDRPKSPGGTRSVHVEMHQTKDFERHGQGPYSYSASSEEYHQLDGTSHKETKSEDHESQTGTVKDTSSTTNESKSGYGVKNGKAGDGFPIWEGELFKSKTIEKTSRDSQSYTSTADSRSSTSDAQFESESSGSYSEPGTSDTSTEKFYDAESVDTQGLRVFFATVNSYSLDKDVGPYTNTRNSYDHTTSTGINLSWNDERETYQSTKTWTTNGTTTVLGKMSNEGLWTTPNGTKYWQEDGSLKYKSTETFSANYTEPGGGEDYFKSGHEFKQDMKMLVETKIETSTYHGKQTGKRDQVEDVDSHFIKQGVTKKVVFPYSIKIDDVNHDEDHATWWFDRNDSVGDYGKDGKDSSEVMERDETESSSWNHFSRTTNEVTKSGGAGLIAIPPDGQMPHLTPDDEINEIKSFITRDTKTTTDVGSGGYHDHWTSSDSKDKQGHETHGGSGLKTTSGGGVETETDRISQVQQKSLTLTNTTTVTEDSDFKFSTSQETYSGNKNWYSETSASGSETNWGNANSISSKYTGDGEGSSHTMEMTWGGSSPGSEKRIDETGAENGTRDVWNRSKTTQKDGSFEKSEEHQRIKDTSSYELNSMDRKSGTTQTNGDFSRDDWSEVTFERTGRQEERNVHDIVKENVLGTGFDIALDIESFLETTRTYTTKQHSKHEDKENYETSPSRIHYDSYHDDKRDFWWSWREYQTVNVDQLAPLAGQLPSLPYANKGQFWGELHQSATKTYNHTTELGYDLTVDNDSTSSQFDNAHLDANGKSGWHVHSAGNYSKVDDIQTGNNPHEYHSLTNGSLFTRATRDNTGTATWDQYNGQSVTDSSSTSPGYQMVDHISTTTQLSGTRLHVVVSGGMTVTTAGSQAPPDPQGTPNVNPGPSTTYTSHASDTYVDAPNPWNPPAPLEAPDIFAALFTELAGIAQDLAELMMYIYQYQTMTYLWSDEYTASTMRSAFETTINPPDFEFRSIWDNINYKFVTTVFADKERLLKGGRFGTGYADALMIVGEGLSDKIGYIDPTPTSDLINAALNGIDGNYTDALMSVGGAMIPGGGEKPIKGAAKIGKSALEGFGNAARKAASSIECNSTRSFSSFIANMLGKCFVGDTEVVIGFEPAPPASGESQAEGGFGSFGQNPFFAFGVGSLMLGAVHFAMLNRKRRKAAGEEDRDDLFTDYELDDSIPRQSEPLPILNEYQFDELCDSLFASEGDFLRDPPPHDTVFEKYSDVHPTANTGVAHAGAIALKMPPTKPKFARNSQPERRSATTKSDVGVPSPRRNGLWLAPWALLAMFCFGVALLPSSAKRASIPSASAAMPVPSPDDAPKYITQRIRDIQVGTWVLADNPESDTSDAFDYSLVPPEVFCIVRVRKFEGEKAALHAEFLSSWSAMENDGLSVGSKMFVDYEEFGVSGFADIEEIRPCPKIPSRPSDHHCLVTATFGHDAQNLINLYVSGLAEPIGVTDTHPFWSADRSQFVPAGELREGENLKTVDGVEASVVRMESRPSEQVFNLEVDGEHVYYVSASGILVHNTCTQGVYVLVDPISKEVKYVGRGDVAARLAKHKLNPLKSHLDGYEVAGGLTKAQAKRLEQLLMDHYGEAKSTNPVTNLLNLIRSYAKTRATTYDGALRNKTGREIIRGVIEELKSNGTPR
jgi:Protein of unknown function (DUF1557).